MHGQSPYGHFPVEDDQPKCGPADASGEVRDRIQTNGRCETANPLGDTYGPVSYLAYIPGYAALRLERQVGHAAGRALHVDPVRPDLPARPGARRPALRRAASSRAALAFAWAAWPFTQYASSSNTNDAIAPALLVWGFLALTSSGRARRPSPSRAGRSSPRSCSSCRSGPATPRRARRAAACVFVSGSSLATALVFFVLLSSRRPGTPRASSTTAPSASSSGGPHRSRSGTGASTTPRACPTSISCSVRSRSLLVVGAVAPRWFHGAARRSGLAALTGGAARRLRARADALVLSLPAVVLPVRRARARGPASRVAGTARR